MIIIMSKPILPRSFKFISFHLIGFLDLWLYDYLLDFTLSFHTQKPIYWHETKGDLTFYVSITYVSIFSSILCGNPKLLAHQVGYWIWASMVVRENGLELILKL